MINAGKMLEIEAIARQMASNIDKEHRHISLIFFKSRCIAMGTNNEKGHAEAIRRNYYSEVPHSELAAYMRVPYTFRDKKLTLVNFRFNRQGQLRMSKPCYKCQPWCEQIFNDIYYSTDRGMIQL